MFRKFPLPKNCISYKERVEELGENSNDLTVTAEFVESLVEGFIVGINSHRWSVSIKCEFAGAWANTALRLAVGLTVGLARWSG